MYSSIILLCHDAESMQPPPSSMRCYNRGDMPPQRCRPVPYVGVPPLNRTARTISPGSRSSHIKPKKRASQIKHLLLFCKEEHKVHTHTLSRHRDAPELITTPSGTQKKRKKRPPGFVLLFLLIPDVERTYDIYVGMYDARMSACLPSHARTHTRDERQNPKREKKKQKTSY